jgi:Uma2 family endonuclease
VSDATVGFDSDVKAKLYGQRGVPEPWIVDVGGQQLHVCSVPRRGEYAQRSTRGAGSIEIPSLRIDVDLSQLFA